MKTIINKFNHEITRELLLLTKGHYKVSGVALERAKKLFTAVYAMSPKFWENYTDNDVHRIFWDSFLELMLIEIKYTNMHSLEMIYREHLEREAFWEKNLTLETLIEAMWGAISCMIVRTDTFELDFGKADPEIQKKLNEIKE